MWSFKNWLNEGRDLDAIADRVFSQRSKNAQIGSREILTALGLADGKLVQINAGSFGNIYRHPTDDKKIIKVTADVEDAANLVKAQRLNSSNVVKVYQSAKVGKRAVALVADYVNGPSMPYNSNTFIALMNGSQFDDAKDAARSILHPDRMRGKILQQHGTDTDAEKLKLSRLFSTLARLEKLNIFMSDFSDNILDAGDDYVIIDMGL